MHACLLRRAVARSALLLSVVGMIACDKDTASRTVTGPAAQAMKLDQQVVRSPRSISSVCAGYENERNAVQTELARRPADAELAQTVGTYRTLIADACE